MLQVDILGYIDFKILIILGNIGLFFVSVAVFNVFRRTDLNLYLFLPVPYLLFNFLSWSNMNWAAGALQNYYVVVFSLLAFIFFSKKGFANIIVSTLFASAATLTSGSGLLIFPVFLIWSFVKLTKPGMSLSGSSTLPKEPLIKTKFIFVILSTVLAVCLYFINHTKPRHHPSIFDSITSPLQFISYSLAFLGSFLQIIPVSIFVGLVILIAFCCLSYKKYYVKNPTVYFF